MRPELPELNTVEAHLMPADKPTVIVKRFKFDTIRQEAYWVTQYAKQFKSIKLANDYINRINGNGN